MKPALLVLGAGPAGLAAAEAASRDGQPVLLIDENHAPGGQVWRGAAAHATEKALRERPHVRLLMGARLVGTAGPGALLLDTKDGARVQPWERLVLCSGARELLLPFPGWTLPGVTGAGGLQALIKGGVPIAGKRVVVAGTGPLLLAVADTVKKQGGQVVAIAEHRGRAELARFAGQLALRHRAKLWQAAHLLAGLRGVPYLAGATLSEARGDGRLASVVIDERELACDFLACGFGLLPSLESAHLLACATGDGKVLVDAQQKTSVAGVWAAGESTGIGGVDKALAEGRIAGLAASGKAPSRADERARSKALDFASLLARSFAPHASLKAACKPDTIVCRCEDVRARELAPHAEWRSAKLQTRAGMGACQGRVCGAACSFLYGWDAAGARPPVFPVSAATLAAVDSPA